MIDDQTTTYDDIYPYKFCRDSGTLDFWNNPEEDIYTFEDGNPINE